MFKYVNVRGYDNSQTSIMIVIITTNQTSAWTSAQQQHLAILL